MTRRRTLVTGATGFVGANLTRRLLRDGYEVHLLVRPGTDRWRLNEIAGEVRLHEAALEDAGAVSAAVGAARPEWVFHLAAYGAYSSQTDVRRMIATNLTGTVNLLEAALAHGCEAFVNAGTSSEYGFKDHAPSEREWLEPNSDYAVTKAAATLYCRNVARARDRHVVTLRLYSVFGPYEEPTRLIPTLIVRGLRGELPPLVRPDGAHDYVYTEDACEAFVLAAGVSGQERGAVYNVGSGVQTTLAEAVEVARRELGIAAEPQWGSMPGRSWDTPHWVCDNRAACEGLGWRPRLAFADGFRATVEWLRARPALLPLYESRRPPA